MLPCFHASMLHASMLPCFHASMLHASMLPCFMFHASCFHASMLPCFHASCFMLHASMLPCFHASMLPCFHASMLPCFHASCFHASMLHASCFMLPCCTRHRCRHPPSTQVKDDYSSEVLRRSLAKRYLGPNAVVSVTGDGRTLDFEIDEVRGASYIARRGTSTRGRWWRTWLNDGFNILYCPASGVVCSCTICLECRDGNGRV